MHKYFSKLIHIWGYLLKNFRIASPQGLAVSVRHLNTPFVGSKTLVGMQCSQPFYNRHNICKNLHALSMCPLSHLRGHAPNNDSYNACIKENNKKIYHVQYICSLWWGRVRDLFYSQFVAYADLETLAQEGPLHCLAFLRAIKYCYMRKY